MRLDVSKALAAEGSEVPFELEGALAETTLLGERVSYPGMAKLEGFYAAAGDEVHVRGQMRFTAASRCVRCLKETQQPVLAPFEARFALTPDASDPDRYVYEGAWVELDAVAADAAQLALPMRWLCAEDCKGLCAICGTDRNQSACSCRIETPTQHPLSAWKQTQQEDFSKEIPSRREH